MKRIAFALAGLLVVALCFAAARHISETVMTVIVGIVMGVGASVIPTVLILGGYDESEKRNVGKRRDYDAPDVTIINYGTLAMRGEIGPPREWRPGEWRQLPARDEQPTVLLLPGGRE
jgi:hypothetical protein